MQDNSRTDPKKQNEVPDEAWQPPVAGELFHPVDESKASPTPADAATPEIPEAPEDKPELLAIPPQPVRKESSKHGLLVLVIIILLAIAAGAAWRFRPGL